METFFDLSSPNYFLKIISLGGSTTTDPIEPISEDKSLLNKLAFGQTRFPDAADPIEHISEENFLLQIFAKMDNFMI